MLTIHVSAKNSENEMQYHFEKKFDVTPEQVEKFKDSLTKRMISGINTKFERTFNFYEIYYFENGNGNEITVKKLSVKNN